jgi:hypothetical protein
MTAKPTAVRPQARLDDSGKNAAHDRDAAVYML